MRSIVRTGTFAAVCLGVLLPSAHAAPSAAPAAPAPDASFTPISLKGPRQTASVSPMPSGVEIAVGGLTLKGCDVSADRREVTLRFAEQVDPAILRALENKGKAVIESVSGGYDTILLRTTQPSMFMTVPTSNGFVLRIGGDGPAQAQTPMRMRGSADATAPAQTQAAAPAAGEPSPRNLVEARYLINSGNTGEARRVIAELKRRGGEDSADLAKLEADADLADGDARAAAKGYEAALRLRPSDEGLRESLHEARAAFAPQIELGAATHDAEDGHDRKTFGYAAARVPVGQVFTLRGRVDNVTVDDNEVRNPGGSVTAFDGNRTRGQIGVAADMGRGWEASATLMASQDVLGGALAYERHAPASSTSLRAIYHEPAWDYTEQIVHAGTRDAVEFEHRQTIANRWFVNIGLRLNRYGMDGDDEIAKSAEVDAGLRWRAIDGPIKLSIGYAFEGEFVGDVQEFDDGMGGHYALLEIANRKVHSVDVRVDAELTERLEAGAYVGYGYEQDGDGGLLAGIEIAYEPAESWRLAFDAGYSAIAEQSGESGEYKHAAFTLTKLFGAGEAGGH